MEYYKGKTVIITGAGSGIGKALSEAFANLGAHVVITDINQERIEQVAEGVRSLGGSVRAQQLDVTNQDAVQTLVEDTLRERGQIDYLFNNAGIVVIGDALDQTIKEWRDVLDVNLYGVINGVNAVYPIMAQQGFGHIINTGSIEGLVPTGGTISYVASKYAVVGLSNTLRIEGASLGVKVSVVCPGHIQTAIFDDSRLVNVDRSKFLSLMNVFPGVTAEKCAAVILKGVEKNKAIISINFDSRLLWYLHRLSPNLTLWFMKRFYQKDFKKVRTPATVT